MDTKQKYVRIKEYNSFIFFPTIIEHSDFKHLNPVSAGFCYIDDGKVSCFGESYSLGIGSKSDDSELATKQVWGIDANEIDEFLLYFQDEGYKVSNRYSGGGGISIWVDHHPFDKFYSDKYSFNNIKDDFLRMVSYLLTIVSKVSINIDGPMAVKNPICLGLVISNKEKDEDKFYYLAFGRLLGSYTRKLSGEYLRNLNIYSLSDVKRCPKFKTKTESRMIKLRSLGI